MVRKRTAGDDDVRPGADEGIGFDGLLPVFAAPQDMVQQRKIKRVGIFSRPRKNTTCPLTVWICGTEIGRGLFSAKRCVILADKVM